MHVRRTRFFFLAASVTSIAAAAIAQGCGETETTSTPADGGADVALDTGKKDTAPPAEEDAATCDLGHDFTTDIPDASIADGASTTGICVGCARANCKKFVDACNKNCQCQELAAKALDCYAKTGDAIGCAGQFASAKITKETQNTAFGLFSCLQNDCEQECATEEFTDGGGDANVKDAADGG